MLKKSAPKKVPTGRTPEEEAWVSGRLEEIAKIVRGVQSTSTRLVNENKGLSYLVVQMTLSVQGLLNSHGCLPGPRECKFCIEARKRVAEIAKRFPEQKPAQEGQGA